MFKMQYLTRLGFLLWCRLFIDVHSHNNNGVCRGLLLASFFFSNNVLHLTLITIFKFVEVYVSLCLVSVLHSYFSTLINNKILFIDYLTYSLIRFQLRKLWLLLSSAKTCGGNSRQKQNTLSLRPFLLRHID